ncbi:MAG: hypothetical protein FWD24_03780 [Treponema sp.]|nr:hypothetical protein [Treponema sp.]
MRIAVVSAPAAKIPPPDYVKELADGMSKMGHHVDVIDTWTEDGMKLPSYEYIAIVAEPVSIFSGKIQTNITKLLSAGSSIGGKKSAAFIKKKGIFYNRALFNLMKVMEKEGMRVNWSDIIFNGPHAQAMGKRIGS